MNEWVQAKQANSVHAAVEGISVQWCTKEVELSSGPSKYPSMVWVMPRSIPRHVKLHGPVVGHPIQEGSDTTPLAGFETRTRVFSAISPQDAFLIDELNPVQTRIKSRLKPCVDCIVGSLVDISLASTRWSMK